MLNYKNVREFVWFDGVLIFSLLTIQEEKKEEEEESTPKKEINIKETGLSSMSLLSSSSKSTQKKE